MPSLTEVLERLENNVPDKTRVYINIVIGKLTLPALIDSGAACHMLFRSDLFYDLQTSGGVRVWPITGEVGVANGQSARIVGKCRPIVSFGSSKWKGPAYLIQNLSYPVVIGFDCLDELGAVLYFSERKLTICPKDKAQVPEVLSVFEVASMDSIEKTVDEDPPDPIDYSKGFPEIEVNHPMVSPEQAQKFKSFIKDWQGKFAKIEGFAKVKPVRLYPDPSCPPVKQRCFPLSPPMQKIAAAEVDKLLAQGIIEPSTSPWASPGFLLPKRQPGQWRLCVDYREVNKVCRKNAYPLPRIQETLDCLKDSFLVSACDLAQGYHQLEMHEDSKDLTAFNIYGRGLFAYRALPFGLSGAPAIFQDAVEEALFDILGKICFVYFDDIIVIGRTFDEHLANLDAVLTRLYEKNFRLNWEKCSLLKRYTDYLGFVVGQGEIRVSPKKIEAIVNFPRPTTQKQLRGFLSLLSWLRRFIPNLAEKSASLTEMLKKGEKICWTEERDRAFRELKQCLCEPPVLLAPDFDYGFEIHADSSLTAVGAILLQNIGGEVRIIAYASRLLTQQERNYSTTERECLAVIFAVEKWRAYVQGQRTIVRTDHASLVWLKNLKDPTGRLARWVTRLAPFDLEIKYTKGKDNAGPDFLSRSFPEGSDADGEVAQVNPLVRVPDFTQSNDKWYCSLKDKIVKFPNRYPMFTVAHNIVYKLCKNRMTNQDELKMVVPTDERLKIVSEFHDTLQCSHFGVNKTYQKILQTYYWPKMLKDVRAYCKTCSVCQTYKVHNQLVAGKMAVKEMEEFKPMEMVCHDLIGPLPISHGYQYLWVCVDSATNFVIAEPLRRATAAAVVKALESKLVLEYGPPKILLTDNGTQMKGTAVKEFCQRYNIALHTLPFYFPSANKTERVNLVLKTALSMWARENHREWSKHLPFVVFAMRSVVSESTGFTPNKLMFGRELPQLGIPDPSLLTGNKVPFDPQKYHNKLSDEMKVIYDKARDCYNRAKATQAKAYNLRRRHVSYEVGQLVYRKNFEKSSGVDRTTRKLNARWIGPFILVKKYSPTQFELSDMSNKSVGRWHVSHLKLVNEDTRLD